MVYTVIPPRRRRQRRHPPFSPSSIVLGPPPHTPDHPPPPTCLVNSTQWRLLVPHSPHSSDGLVAIVLHLLHSACLIHKHPHALVISHSLHLRGSHRGRTKLADVIITTSPPHRTIERERGREIVTPALVSPHRPTHTSYYSAPETTLHLIVTAHFSQLPLIQLAHSLDSTGAHSPSCPPAHRPTARQLSHHEACCAVLPTPRLPRSTTPRHRRRLLRPWPLDAARRSGHSSSTSSHPPTTLVTRLSPSRRSSPSAAVPSAS